MCRMYWYMQTDCLRLVARLGVWSAMMDLLEEWAAAYGSILILSGPIFDYDVDGLKDTEFEL